MKIAIYSRKSKFTGKGESIENQIEMCRQYIVSHFGNECEIFVYEDEGFSGGTIDRPQFKLMMRDANLKKFNVLVCYRLDRVSRNISDFSTLIEDLESTEISFVSIREQFDTTTPMGRAMMYISSVFAQLERETIAERIRDNMLQLAKTGRWLGGTTPTGFESKEVVVIDNNGKERKAFKLSPIPEEIKIIELIFDKFLELKSLTQLEAYLIQNEIKTKNGAYFARVTLRTMIKNPVYAIADEVLYSYLQLHGYDVYSAKHEFDSSYGVMAYNKTIQKKNKSNKTRDNSEWIIAIGAHKGVIEGSKWVKAQEIINNNKSKSFRKVQNQDCLLSGILICAKCGSFMRPKVGRVNQNGDRVFYYQCEMKERSKRTKCTSKNAHGLELDEAIETYLKSLSADESNVRNKVKNGKISFSTQSEVINNELEIVASKIKNNEASINNLVTRLSQFQETAASKYIIDQINTFDSETSILKTRLLELTQKSDSVSMKNEELELVDDIITSLDKTIGSVDIHSKRKLIRTVVERILWDGENADIILFGADNLEK